MTTKVNQASSGWGERGNPECKSFKYKSFFNKAMNRMPHSSVLHVRICTNTKICLLSVILRVSSQVTKEEKDKMIMSQIAAIMVILSKFYCGISTQQ
jgi:hypothetical protein